MNCAIYTLLILNFNFNVRDVADRFSYKFKTKNRKKNCKTIPNNNNNNLTKLYSKAVHLLKTFLKHQKINQY
jgi:hypothetical protein